jgi:hypothetical protein
VISSKNLHSTSSRAQTGLQQQLEEVTAEKQRLESKLASISDDRGSVQEQLQEVCTWHETRDFSLFKMLTHCSYGAECRLAFELQIANMTMCRLYVPSPWHKLL